MNVSHGWTSSFIYDFKEDFYVVNLTLKRHWRYLALVNHFFEGPHVVNVTKRGQQLLRMLPEWGY